MNFISQAASTTGTQEGMHDGEGTAGAWQREGTAGTHDGERTSGAWQEGGDALPESQSICRLLHPQHVLRHNQSLNGNY